MANINGLVTLVQFIASEEEMEDQEQCGVFRWFTVHPGEQPIHFSTGSQRPLLNLRFDLTGSSALTVTRISGMDGSLVAAFSPPATADEVTRYFKTHPVPVSRTGDFTLHIHNSWIRQRGLNVGLTFKKVPARRRLQAAAGMGVARLAAGC